MHNKYAQLPLKSAAGQPKLRAFLYIRSAQRRTKTRSILAAPDVGRYVTRWLFLTTIGIS